MKQHKMIRFQNHQRENSILLISLVSFNCGHIGDFRRTIHNAREFYEYAQRFGDNLIGISFLKANKEQANPEDTLDNVTRVVVLLRTGRRRQQQQPALIHIEEGPFFIDIND